MPAEPAPPADAHVDVLIVGAGISGISMAAHMGMHCPTRSYAIVEQRMRLGGTWDLFRYPGVRSDSDMYTLGFAFEPWMDADAIAPGDRILAYLDRVVDTHGIRPHIRFDTKVRSADFRASDGRWHIMLEDAQGLRSMMAGVLYLGAGYYDYDTPHDPQLPGLDSFAGHVAHPQFWPEGLDYAGKRVVVVGSGATAVTLVPAMAAGGAAHVTMLQRTPTWMASLPARDPLARLAMALLPTRMAYRLIRAKNVRFQDFVFKLSRRAPDRLARQLTHATKKALGRHYHAPDYQPPYAPWDQRLCLVPDGDFFAAIRQNKAEVVTGTIAAIEPDGIRLNDGRHLPADLLVTATGLKLSIAGGVKVMLDGHKVSWRKHFYYRSAMFSDVPNLFVVFGYLNASWTLRADLTARYACDVLNTMVAKSAAIACPRLPDHHVLEEDNVFHFTSGYIERARALMPKSAKTLPWRLNQDYRQDRRDFRTRPVVDGLLCFEKAQAPG